MQAFCTIFSLPGRLIATTKGVAMARRNDLKGNVLMPTDRTFGNMLNESPASNRIFSDDEQRVRNERGAWYNPSVPEKEYFFGARPKEKGKRVASAWEGLKTDK